MLDFIRSNRHDKNYFVLLKIINLISSADFIRPNRHDKNYFVLLKIINLISSAIFKLYKFVQVEFLCCVDLKKILFSAFIPTIMQLLNMLYLTLLTNCLICCVLLRLYQLVCNT